MNQEWINIIKKELPELLVLTDETMAEHTTFKIGGPADIYVEPDMDQLVELIRICSKEDIPYTVLGNGSNVLVSDNGIRGLTIVIGKPMSLIEQEDNIITAQAGALLSAVAAKALATSMTGMEGLAGIPGSVGGAVLMNAGAYGSEIKDVIVSARVLTEDGKVIELTKEELGLSYRHSAIMEHGGIVLDATFELVSGSREDISGAMKEYARLRVEKQPLEYPSAGSTFKRPEGYFAGKLIQDAGLKGYRVGGAVISKKHSGFVVNDAGASASDVCQLMDDVAKRVFEEFQVVIEPEVRFVGEF